MTFPVENILIMGPCGSRRSSLMLKLIFELPPYAKLVVADDTIVDTKHWRDNNTFVICTGRFIHDIPIEQKNLVDVLYVSNTQLDQRCTFDKVLDPDWNLRKKDYGQLQQPEPTEVDILKANAIAVITELFNDVDSDDPTEPSDTS